MNTETTTTAFASLNNLRLVNSTAVRFVAYDSFLRELRVVFNSGSCYDYKDVAPKTYSAMIGARSVGRYFRANIRNNYRYNRVDGTDAQLYLLEMLRQCITSNRVDGAEIQVHLLDMLQQYIASSLK